MKKKTALMVPFIACCTMLLFQTSIGYCSDSKEQKYVPNEVLVRFHDGVDESQKEFVRSSLNAVLVKVIKSIRVEYWKLSKDVSTEEALEKLKNNPFVEYAEPNYLSNLQAVPNDPYFNKLWHLRNNGQIVNGFSGLSGADIKATQAWDIFKGKQEIIVAVIDTGCAITHPDLVDAIWINESESNGTPYFDDDGNGYEDDVFGWNFMDDYSGWEVFGDVDHGTHVSGIIAATTDNNEGIAGICNNIKLMTLRASSDGYFSVFTELEAFEYARLNGAKIVNCSFGGDEDTYSQLIYNEISLLNKNGILVVAAAGNGGTDKKGDDNDITHQYPSDYNLPNIISVAATDNNDNLATFSNYGLNSVDVGAPGKDIYSTIPSYDLIYYEDMEGVADDWTIYGTGLWYTEYNSFYNTNEAIFYFHNSNPNLSYLSSEIDLENPINLTGKYGNKLIFDGRWNIPADAWLMVLGSTNPTDANSWTILDYGYGPSWVTRSTISIALDIFGFADIPQFYIAFGIYYPYSPAGLHWVSVDDIAVTSFANFTYTGNEFEYLDGTSMAAPVVTGIAALVWSQNSTLTHLQVKDIILNSVDKLPSLNGKVVSGGRVNAYKALLPALNAPSLLNCKATSSTQIAIGWRDNSSNETGFKVERKAGGCGSANPWVQIAIKLANTTSHTVSGLSPNTNYAFRVRAYQSTTNSAYSNCATSKTGLSGTPPSPTNFTATSSSATRIVLKWKDNSSNEIGFRIYRKIGVEPFVLLHTTGEGAVSYSDTSATNNQSSKAYQYFICAYNTFGNSPATNAALVPYKPINLAVSPGPSASSKTLTWTDKGINETGYEVYRKAGGCASANEWARVAVVGTNVKIWTNTGLNSGNTYSYQVRAINKSTVQPNAYGYSQYSNCSSAAAP